jgi:hypothetical protein
MRLIDKKRWGMKKTQTILDYIVSLSTIVVMILVGLGFMHRGMSRGFTDMSEGVNAQMPLTTDDTFKEEEIVFDPEERGLNMLPAESYEGREFFEDRKFGGYYFREGDSDMSGVPEAGTTLETTQHPVTVPPGLD